MNYDEVNDIVCTMLDVTYPDGGITWERTTFKVITQIDLVYWSLRADLDYFTVL